jgi:hypothetical protein
MKTKISMGFAACRFAGFVFLVLQVALIQEACRAQDGVIPSAPRPVENLQINHVPAPPYAIDARDYLHPKLSQQTTHAFSEASLQEVANWLSQQTGFLVIIDEYAFQSKQQLLSTPITDQIKDVPIYRLLDRLVVRGIDWELVEDIVYIRPTDDKVRYYTEQYNISGLLEQGFNGENLQQLMEELGSLTSKSEAEDPAVDLLGELIFVRDNHNAHRQFACLLAALQKPAKRVLINEPLEHQLIHEALERKTSVKFQGTPLITAIQQISHKENIDIRLDEEALLRIGKPLRIPINLEIQDHKLRGILNAIASQQRMSWVIGDGVLWFTTPKAADVPRKMALYDVRDLCINDEESLALRDAVMRQLTPEDWRDAGGSEIITFPKAGLMVVTHKETHLDSLLKLLDQYRSAIRSFKRKPFPEADPDGLETRYYRMPTEVATDLVKALPELVEPSSWLTGDNPQGWGTMRALKSWSDEQAASKEPFSVLVIQQKRKIHAEIQKLLTNIRFGEATDLTSHMMGGMGGMGSPNSGNMGGSFGSGLAP